MKADTLWDSFRDFLLDTEPIRFRDPLAETLGVLNFSAWTTRKPLLSNYILIKFPFPLKKQSGCKR
jgi:hypothetical protein